MQHTTFFFVKRSKITEDEDVKAGVVEEAYNGISVPTLLNMSQHSVNMFGYCL